MQKYLVGLMLISSLCFALPTQLEARDFLRGDVNEDGSVNIADGVNMLSYMFSGGFVM